MPEPVWKNRNSHRYAEETVAWDKEFLSKDQYPLRAEVNHAMYGRLNVLLFYQDKNITIRTVAREGQEDLYAWKRHFVKVIPVATAPANPVMEFELK